MGEMTGIDTPRMNWSAEALPAAFNAFKLYCELIFKGPLAEKSEEQQVTYVLLWVGEEGRRMFNSWSLSAADKKKLKKIWDKFEEHVEPKANFRLARLHLQRMKQDANESMDEFIVKIKNQSKKCKFRDDKETDERLIEQLIFGTKHRRVQEKLISKDDKLTLDNAIDIARTHESTLSQVEEISGAGAEAKIQAVQKTKEHKCMRCGGQHTQKQKCPALGTSCGACGKPNHWERVCFSKQENQTKLGHSKGQPPSRPKKFNQQNRTKN